MAEVKHTCPYCGHDVGRLMRVRGEGVSSCASCHKSDWSRRFLFPESDADRAQREARQARREEAIRFDSASSDEEAAGNQFTDGDFFTTADQHQQEHEELIQRARDEESMKWAKGIVIGFLVLLVLIVWSRASGNGQSHPNDPTCQYAGRSMECW